MDSSDYGSDVDIDGEDGILRLLTTPTAATTTATPTTATHDGSPPARRGGGADGDAASPSAVSPSSSLASQCSQYFDCPETRTPPPSTVRGCAINSLTRQPATVGAESAEQPDAPASAAPFDRFRSRKKSLSVTDLVSGIWCEQQFEYSLVTGFRRTTPQMAGGSLVHKQLEDQVHDSVPIAVASAEDRWALKLLNVFQGLLSLRRLGVTRELPVFGFLGDVFVQGIVDEISYLDPLSRESALSRDSDSSSSSRGGSPGGRRRRRPSANGEGGDGKATKQRRRSKKAAPPAGPDAAELAVYSTAVPVAGGERIAYLSDTKTRHKRSLPSESQWRTTAMQLMLYRRLLAHLRLGAADDFARLLALFALDGHAPLSDNFVAQIAALANDDDLPLDALLAHNSLWGLWALLTGQFAAAVGGVGGTMGVSYRLQADSSIIAFKTVAHDDAALDAHLAEALRWWRGERPTVGVDIEEAWKCTLPSILSSSRNVDAAQAGCASLKPSAPGG